MIAIIEPMGGWLASDMKTFFQGIDQPLPQITDIFVDGTANAPDPDNPNLPDLEVALDIQTAAASYYVATGMPATIQVYWTQDIASGVRSATVDGCDVCSISWGWTETDDEPDRGMGRALAMDQAAIDAVEAGMIVFAAAGDLDSSDGGCGPRNVEMPAASPHVIACGGTTKRGTRETVWNSDPGSSTGIGTGGGFSRWFAMPDWQSCAPNGSGRMIPDVAANADPATGYRIVVHGQQEVGGGTSAVAPLYAGLFASFGQKLGFVTPELWSRQTCFQDITSGDNGAYRAMQGPDPCSGLGVPIGKKLAALLARSAADASRQARRLSWCRPRARVQIAYER